MTVSSISSCTHFASVYRRIYRNRFASAQPVAAVHDESWPKREAFGARVRRLRIERG